MNETRMQEQIDEARARRAYFEALEPAREAYDEALAAAEKAYDEALAAARLRRLG